MIVTRIQLRKGSVRQGPDTPAFTNAIKADEQLHRFRGLSGAQAALKGSIVVAERWHRTSASALQRVRCCTLAARARRLSLICDLRRRRRSNKTLRARPYDGHSL